MIPSRDKPKYKPLVRLRTDVWQTLQNKQLKKKKWRSILSFFKRNRKSKKTHCCVNYESHNVSRFPVYHRYNYQKNLFLRIHIKLLYGRIQDFKIKQISHAAKKQSWHGFAQRLEQTPASFLHRLKLASSYGEARLHEKHKRIYVNGNTKVKKIKKGDVLHFNPTYAKLLKRRIYTNFLNSNKIKYGIHSCIDFDINSIRFFFLSNIKYFKNHPFKLPFIRVIRWYTRV